MPDYPGCPGKEAVKRVSVYDILVNYFRLDVRLIWRQAVCTTVVYTDQNEKLKYLDLSNMLCTQDRKIIKLVKCKCNIKKLTSATQFIHILPPG